MLRGTIGAIAVVLLALSCVAQADVVANLADDWGQALVDSGDTRAPQGAYNWTYGSIPTSGSTFSQFTGAFGGGTNCWSNDNIYSTGAYFGSSDYGLIRNQAGYNAGASWDSEVTGEIRVSGTFYAYATNQWTWGHKAVLSVMVNGVLIESFESVANGQMATYPPAFDPAYDIQAFDVMLNVNAGDDVQILSTNVGTMDYTFVKAQIETVPEPVTMGMLALGGGMVMLRRRNRR